MLTLSVKRVDDQDEDEDENPAVNRERDVVHPIVIEAWIQNEINRKVFPLLCELRVDWTAEIRQTMVLSLASPSLRMLHLRCDNLAEAIAFGFNDIFRDNLLHISTNLQSLTLKVDLALMPCDETGLVAFIRGWKQLQEVDLYTTTTYTLLNSLSSANQLHTLKLCSPGAVSPTTFHPFPALRDLTLTRCDLATATQFISNIWSSSLRHVVIYAPCRPPRTHEAFIDLARALSQRAELETIRILQAGRSIPNAYNPTADLQLFVSPLLSLSRLRCLALVLPAIWSAGEDIIASISQAWPALEELDIRFLRNKLAISPHIFALFLNRCSQVRIFNVVLDLSSNLTLADALGNPSADSERSLAALLSTPSPTWSSGDELIASISQAWPALQELDFAIPGHDLEISLNTFALVMSRCPRIRIFNVAVNLFSPVPPLAALRTASAVSDRSLAELRFTAFQSPPPAFEIAPLVEFLHAACPAVKCRVCWGTCARRGPKLPQVARIQALLDALVLDVHGR